MKEFLSIGELANIFNMDVQLLRYYDARGLLVPTVRNESNGRRFYHFDQVYPLATIRYLRKLGYSLEQIGSFLSNSDVGKNIDSMAEQANVLQQRCRELMTTVDIIQTKIRFIRQETEDACENTFRVKEYPARQFLHVGEEIDLFTSEFFYFYPTVGFYTADRKWFGAYLFGGNGVETLLEETKASAAVIPAGRYFCGYHYGPYISIRDSIRRLQEEGTARGYRLDSCVVTLNIIDQFSEGCPENYITALEARITDPTE